MVYLDMISPSFNRLDANVCSIARGGFVEAVFASYRGQFQAPPLRPLHAKPDVSGLSEMIRVLRRIDVRLLEVFFLPFCSVFLTASRRLCFCSLRYRSWQMFLLHGDSVLAAAAMHDASVVGAFPSGVIWLRAGRGAAGRLLRMMELAVCQVG